MEFNMCVNIILLIFFCKPYQNRYKLALLRNFPISIYLLILSHTVLSLPQEKYLVQDIVKDVLGHLDFLDN